MSLKNTFFNFFLVIVLVFGVFSALYVKIAKQQNQIFDLETEVIVQQNKLENQKQEKIEHVENTFIEDYDQDRVLSLLLMNYAVLETVELLPEVKAALALAQTGIKNIPRPQEENNFYLSDVCSFESAEYDDTVVIKRVDSDAIPEIYTVYYCEQDTRYGGGYFVRKNYEGSISGTGQVHEIERWYGPFSEQLAF